MTDKPKRPRDANQLAKFIVDVATGEASEQQAGVKMTKLEVARQGGLVGGPARARALTDEERRKIGIKGATARWRKGHPAQETKE